ncbi:MAG: bifunctional adenosylcobinamide kinase/adenosylcobinamide-phosphate guanylyltransferase [Verrucomicrobiae bacterium]|nr:bifunctional adenosylcobinamide kinase/adenosylcobinamide-phosphate guanylyltransferase [Verrucomicrobiae bacterium]
MTNERRQLILILGGARSGKSALALQWASRLGQRKLFIATAEPSDDEMRARIAKHRAARGSDWTTVEAPVALAAALRQHAGGFDVALVDCLTVWLGNLMCRQEEPKLRAMELLTELAARQTNVILVSNEVGLGIVPDNELGRRFRDEQGRLNQQAAAVADTVVFVAAGLPMLLKGNPP